MKANNLQNRLLCCLKREVIVVTRLKLGKLWNTKGHTIMLTMILRIIFICVACIRESEILKRLYYWMNSYYFLSNNLRIVKSNVFAKFDHFLYIKQNLRVSLSFLFLS